MPRPQIKLPYGLSGGTLVHIADATQGSDCGCLCPACKRPLVARKGNVNTHHFAHAAGSQCAAAVETALHLACKRILLQRHEIVLPAVTFAFRANREPFIVAPERRYRLDDVYEERRTGDIVPDLLAHVDRHPLLIEIRVTHALDAEKLQKIKQLDLSAIEIDLSKAPRDFAPAALADLLVDQTGNKKWAHNVKAAYYERMLLASGDCKRIIDRGLARHFDGCPIHAREWHGKSYANVIDDCSSCPYCLGVTANFVELICGGRLKITDIAQLRAYLKTVETTR